MIQKIKFTGKVELNQTIVKDSENFNTELSSALKRASKARTIKEVQLIGGFLSTTKLVDKIKSENLSQEALQRILISISYFFRIKRFNQFQFVFYQGDMPDNFYIILEGEAEVLLDEIYNSHLTAEAYFSHLIEIKKQQDNALIERIIRSNKDIFFINHKDIEKLDKVLCLLKNSSQINSLVVSLQRNAGRAWQIIVELKSLLATISEQLSHNFESVFNLIERFSELSHDQESMNEYLFNLSQLINKEIESIDIDLTPYSYYYSKVWPEKVYLTRRKSVSFLGKGSFFGDIGIEGDKKRSASIRAKGTLVLGCLSAQTYREYISIEANRAATKNIQILQERFIFKTIPRSVFVAKHYPNFSKHSYKQENVMVQDLSKITNIIFILSGSVDIWMYKSIIELHELYKDILYQLCTLTKRMNLSENVQNEIETLKSSDAEFSEMFLATKNSKIVEKLKDRKEIKVATLEQYSLIGLEEILLKKMIWNKKIVCTSEVIDVFEINRAAFLCCINEGSSMAEFNKRGVQETLIFLTRLHNIRQNSFERQAQKQKYEATFNRTKDFDSELCFSITKNALIPKETVYSRRFGKQEHYHKPDTSLTKMQDQSPIIEKRKKSNKKLPLPQLAPKKGFFSTRLSIDDLILKKMKGNHSSRILQNNETLTSRFANCFDNISSSMDLRKTSDTAHSMMYLSKNGGEKNSLKHFAFIKSGLSSRLTPGDYHLQTLMLTNQFITQQITKENNSPESLKKEAFDLDNYNNYLPNSTIYDMKIKSHQLGSHSLTARPTQKVRTYRFMITKPITNKQTQSLKKMLKEWS